MDAVDQLLQHSSSSLVDYIFDTDSDNDSDSGSDSESESECELLLPDFDLEMSCSERPDSVSMDLGKLAATSQAPISEEVQCALATALSSKSLTPILKEELRCKIQLNRLQHGQEEITPDFTEKTFSMSLDEIVKKNRKLEQNRLSAHRSRLKQKTVEENIKSRLTSLERHNEWLGEQIKSLRQACGLARQWLEQHQECLLHTARLAQARAGRSLTSPPSSALLS